MLPPVIVHPAPIDTAALFTSKTQGITVVAAIAAAPCTTKNTLFALTPVPKWMVVFAAVVKAPPILIINCGLVEVPALKYKSPETEHAPATE